MPQSRSDQPTDQLPAGHRYGAGLDQVVVPVAGYVVVVAVEAARGDAYLAGEQFMTGVRELVTRWRTAFGGRRLRDQLRDSRRLGLWDRQDSSVNLLRRYRWRERCTERKAE